MARHQRLKFSAGGQKMAHSVGLLRGFDENLPDAPDEIPLRVIGLRTHQFCGIQLHSPAFPERLGRWHPRRLPSLSHARSTKNPRTGKLRPRASASYKWTYL